MGVFLLNNLALARRVGYSRCMRYGLGLHATSKRHILHRSHRRLGGLLSLFWLLATLLALAVVLKSSDLDYGQFLTGFSASISRVVFSYIVALIIALVLALLVTSHKALEAFLLPILDVLQSFPSFALFPVLTHALANHSEVVVAIVLVITMIWPMIFSIIGALKNRREDLEEAATIFHATGWKRIWHFTLPELWPAIVTGSIVGWGEGWELIIGAELLVSVHWGVGRYLGILGESGQNATLAFGIVSLMLLLFIVNRMVWLPLLHRSTEYHSES